jgi:hypothetical protein
VEKPSPVAAKPVASPQGTPVFAHPSPQDFSSIFSAPLDELFESGGHDYSPEEQTQVLRPVHPVEERNAAPRPFEVPYSDIPHFVHPPEPAPRPVVIEPAEVIDAPAPMRSALHSVNEVADLLRGLDNPSQRARLAAASAAVEAEEQRERAASSRATRVLGWLSLSIGAVALALSCLAATARFGVPVGSAGLLLAVTGLAIAVGRRAGVGVPIGGAMVSAAGLGVALLWAYGLLPMGASGRPNAAANTPSVTLVANTQPAGNEAVASVEYVPATSPLILDHVQLRVTSVLLLRPAVYKGDYDSLRTADDRRLQITLELKKIGADRTVFQPWRRDSEGHESIVLTGSDGIVLASDAWAFPDEEHWLAAGALREPALLGPTPTSDVLLFEPPTGPIGDLLLDLPGRNIGQPGMTLHIRIPRAMVRVQGG